MRITIRLLTGLFLIMWLTDPLYEEEPMQVHPLAIMIVGTIFFASLYSGRELPKLPSEEKFKVDYKSKLTEKQIESELAKLRALKAEHKEAANEKEKEHWRYIIKNGVIQGQYKVGTKVEPIPDVKDFLLDDQEPSAEFNKEMNKALNKRIGIVDGDDEEARFKKTMEWLDDSNIKK